LFGDLVLRCEVCGRRIHGEPRKALIEGAKMLVCEDCAELGSIYPEPDKKFHKTSSILSEKAKTFPAIVSPIRRQATNFHQESELVERYGSLIRESREKLGLSHRDLGRKIGEKVSVLKKVESEKMLPDERLATKLEHVLKVRLLVEAQEHEVPEKVFSSPSSHLTLGDIAHLKTGKRRNPENESINSS